MLFQGQKYVNPATHPTQQNQDVQVNTKLLFEVHMSFCFMLLSATET